MASNAASGVSEDDEQLAVVHPDGTPTGLVKSRAAVHTDGDWHCTRTVWALLPAAGDAGPALVLQQRGPFKASWPNRLDASSAGHLRVGDPDPWREAEEELGRRPGAGEVLPLGRRQSGCRLPNGQIDLEVQELWLWRCPHDLLDLQPPYPEVRALLAVAPDDLQRLAAGVVPADSGAGAAARRGPRGGWKRGRAPAHPGGRALHPPGERDHALHPGGRKLVAARGGSGG